MFKMALISQTFSLVGELEMHTINFNARQDFISSVKNHAQNETGLNRKERLNLTEVVPLWTVSFEVSLI